MLISRKIFSMEKNALNILILACDKFEIKADVKKKIEIILRGTFKVFPMFFIIIFLFK